jgi:hypothetical protein
MESAAIERVPNTEASNTSSQSTSKWSWGAFIYNILFGYTIGKPEYLLLFFVYMIPFVNILAMFATSIYFGLKGRALAEHSPLFKNKDEFNGFMNGIDKMGFFNFIVCFILFGLALVVGLLGGLGALSLMKNTKPMQQYNYQQNDAAGGTYPYGQAPTDDTDVMAK